MSTASEQAGNRQCGACTVCCTVLPIESRELRKLPGAPCRHLEGAGCSIYGTRYSICRTYECGWRVLNTLDDGWRPDQSGVLITPLHADLPPGYREGLEFLIVTGEDAIRAPAFAPLLADAIGRGTAVFFAVPGPPGHYSARLFLNGMLAGAVAREDLPAIRETLIKILHSAAGHAFEKMLEA